MPTADERDWFLTDRPLSASLLQASLRNLVVAQLDDFVVLQPPAEAENQENFQDPLPPGEVGIVLIQERVRVLSVEQKIAAESFTLLLPLKYDGSWVLASVLFESARGTIEFFDPLHGGNDNETVAYDSDSYEPLGLVRQFLVTILPFAEGGHWPSWAWKVSLRRCPGQSKNDSGVSACLAAMHIVSGTSIPANSDMLLARRLLYSVLSCAAPMVHRPSSPGPDHIGTISAEGRMGAPAEECRAMYFKSFRDRILDCSHPGRPTPGPEAAPSSQPADGMARLLESNRLSSLAAVEQFRRRHEVLSRAEALSTEALEQSSHLTGVVLLLLDHVRKGQARSRIRLGRVKIQGDARRFRLQFHAIAMAMDAFERERSEAGERPLIGVGGGDGGQQVLEAVGAEESPEEKGVLQTLDALDVLERALELMLTDLNGWQKEINTVVAEL